MALLGTFFGLLARDHHRLQVVTGMHKLNLLNVLCRLALIVHATLNAHRQLHALEIDVSLKQLLSKFALCLHQLSHPSQISWLHLLAAQKHLD